MSNVQYDQPTKEPTPKVQAAGVGGAVASILIFIADRMLNVEIPGDVGAALATVIAFFAAYMTRDRKPPEAVPLIQGEKVHTDNFKG